LAMFAMLRMTLNVTIPLNVLRTPKSCTV
jgi:hypothetical protein